MFQCLTVSHIPTRKQDARCVCYNFLEEGTQLELTQKLHESLDLHLVNNQNEKSK